MSPEMKNDPQIAAARKAMADLYRRMRKDDKKIARTLWSRTKAAYKILATSLADSGYRI